MKRRRLLAQMPRWFVAERLGISEWMLKQYELGLRPVPNDVLAHFKRVIPPPGYSILQIKRKRDELRRLLERYEHEDA